MSKPLISIITIVYNNCEGIERTLKSVLDQTYPSIEYIVIDGGSTDGTREIIQQYQSGITVFVSEPDNGIYDAMNKGLKLATGELIGIINSGDHFENYTVKRVVNAYFDKPAYDVYHGMIRVFSANGQFQYVIGNDHSFLTTGMIEHPSCFVKRTIYERYGYFSLEYKSSSDYDFMLMLLKKKAEFYFIECILANFYAGGMSSKPTAILESLRIRHKYGLISTTKRVLFENFIKLRYRIRK